jgi:hypothetical protein
VCEQASVAIAIMFTSYVLHTGASPYMHRENIPKPFFDIVNRDIIMSKDVSAVMAAVCCHWVQLIECYVVVCLVLSLAEADAGSHQNGATRAICHREIRVQLQLVGIGFNRHLDGHSSVWAGRLCFLKPLSFVPE